MTKKPNWWEGLSVYHIYLRSFYDSNGDGAGDLPGVIEKLDYLAGKPDSLGINTIWISPFYASPMADFGYDIADYYRVDPSFGTMADFESLVNRAHGLGVRVIIDYVPNHTSDKHEWFKESRSNRKNLKRDWYTWRDSKPDGSPPNNWKSVFGGSAWQYDEHSKQYYLHTFLKEQPDLNWDNPDVRKEMKNVIKFWLDKGVDGLRVDAVSWLSKDRLFRDDLLNPTYQSDQTDPYHEVLHNHSCAGPKLFDYLNEMVDVCHKYKNRFMITEAYPETSGEISQYLDYYKKLRHNICAPFNFECISLPWSAHVYRVFIDSFQKALPHGQPPIYVMGNHDKPRLASRVGEESAKTAALLLTTLPGIPFIYYGDELGLTNTAIPKNKLKDPSTTLDGVGRDQSRTPMQWNDEPQAGFSSTESWLPVSPDYRSNNVAKQSSDSRSILNLYKSLLRLRHKSEALKTGSYQSLDLGDSVYGFVRGKDSESFTISINFSDRKIIIDSVDTKGSVVLSTYRDDYQNLQPNDNLILRPHEGVIISAS